ncbi:TetR/AcrR family transcriptional regulator [Actinomadura darangshiensis]|uniref:TetR/AcrR family transcriptional regulator n=1 Tax=Actinomadura darangshiensis TaxID=705336 RepID=A0A4V2YWA3_9ACTN|nr:TetR/AcrR family transcriptional regulator [Actinomadura darangshiensis]TDD84647.1 TetR/AcrR family transcriptional regulator [Actinomadura darangshiensis]
MGNREDLLAGAKRCLLAKGYTRTTARDIAAESGVSLAAIGYHFGSKEVLLQEALRDAITEWGDGIAAVLAAETDPAAPAAERLEAIWDRIVGSFAGTRPLWALQFEVIAHIERTPDLRASFAEANRQARLGLAELFGTGAEAVGDRHAERVGAYYQTMLAGMAAQWLIDPQTAPSGPDLVAAMRTVAAGIAP